MIRLLAVRAAIVTLKRAISLSDRLKPATWEFLAICCAALFVLSAWGLQQSQQQRTRHGTSSLAPQVVKVVRFESGVRPNSQPFNESIRGENPVAGWLTLSHQSGDVDRNDHSAMMMVESDYYLHFSVSRNVFGSVPASTINPLITSYAWNSTPLLAATTNIEDSRFPVQPPDLLDLVKSFKQAPTVIYQPTTERGGGLGKEVMFWAPILGLLLSPITGVGMLILGWLGHHRRRREDILLQLQIAKINLENENISLVNEKLKLELALAQQEADKPRIISG